MQGRAFSSGFLPSGTGFEPAFAARELAAAGIMELQLGEGCPAVTPAEAPCAVAEYEAAANQLAEEWYAWRDSNPRPVAPEF